VDEAQSADGLFADLNLSDQLFKDDCHAQTKTLSMDACFIFIGFFLVCLFDSYTIEQ
jgi:hypothetical protein